MDTLEEAQRKNWQELVEAMRLQRLKVVTTRREAERLAREYERLQKEKWNK